MPAMTPTADPPRPPAVATPADGARERAVLTHLLDAHPRRLTLAQLAGDLGGSDAGPLQRAVANLTAAGLLVAEEERLSAAPTALRVDRLALRPA